jgi:hypothetical protein
VASHRRNRHHNSLNVITKENFELYAAKHYNNPGCVGVKEFKEDLKRIKYIKRLLNKYLTRGELNERLLLNHIISLRNVFEHHTVPILFFKMEPKYWSAVKTFLVFLECLPDNYRINDTTLETDIPIDGVVANTLRKI